MSSFRFLCKPSYMYLKLVEEQFEMKFDCLIAVTEIIYNPGGLKWQRAGYGQSGSSGAGRNVNFGGQMYGGTHTFHNAICFIFMQNVRRI